MDKKLDKAISKPPSRAFIRSLMGKHKGKELLNALVEEKNRTHREEKKRQQSDSSNSD